ncbi:MAG: hypothetical protein IPK60_18315 [Sandaracinaceae bacterium]|nr:hypothetical protein [Sandaracinaceae bacterium]
MFSSIAARRLVILSGFLAQVFSVGCVAEQARLPSPGTPDEPAPPVMEPEVTPADGPAIHLHASNAVLRVVDGERSELGVTLTRVGTVGAVDVHVEGLPRGVYADDITIPGTSSRGALIFTTAAPISFGGPVAFHLRATTHDLSARADMRAIMTVAGAPGSFDESYSYDGIVTHHVSPDADASDAVKSCAMDRYDNITVVGTTQHAMVQHDAFAMRILRDGDLDARWGFRGVLLGLPELGAQTSNYADVAVMNDGSVLLLGSIRSASGGENLLTRRTTEGLVDTSFGNRGFMRRISQDTTWLASRAEGFLLANEGFEAFTRSGERDLSFGGGKIDETPFVRHFSSIDREGRLLVAGTTGQVVNVARYAADGSVDSLFGYSGIAEMRLASRPASIRVRDMAEQSDGSVVIAGDEEDAAGASRGIVIRFAPNGSLDTSFAERGIAREDALGSRIVHIVIDSADRIVVAGTRDDAGSRTSYLARYNPDGSTDCTFGDDGQVRDIELMSVNELFVNNETGRLYACGGISGGVAIARFWN